jgi:hypothetical protein
MCNRSHKFAYEVHRSVASVVAAAARFVWWAPPPARLTHDPEPTRLAQVVRSRPLGFARVAFLE